MSENMRKTQSRTSLNTKISENYYSFLGSHDSFDSTDSVARISDLVFKRGYSMSTRLEKIDSLLQNVPTYALVEQEKDCVIQALDIMDNYVGMQGNKRIKNYDSVKKKIIEIREKVQTGEFYKPLETSSSPIDDSSLVIRPLSPPSLESSIVQVSSSRKRPSDSLSTLQRIKGYVVKNAVEFGLSAVLMASGLVITGCGYDKSNEQYSNSLNEISSISSTNLLEKPFFQEIQEKLEKESERSDLASKLSVAENEVAKLKSDSLSSSNQLQTLNENYRVEQGKVNELKNKLNEVVSASNSNFPIGTNAPSNVIQDDKFASAYTSIQNSSTNQPVISNGIPLADTPTVTSIDDPVETNKGLCERIGDDVDKYRVYGVQHGSRKVVTSLKSTVSQLEETVLTDGTALITASYGNDKFKKSREDDIRPKKFLGNFGNKFVGFFKRLSGPIFDRDAYKGSHLGPITYVGRVVTGGVSLALETPNVPTLGLANNIIDPVFGIQYDAIETGKFASQSALNVTRLPVKDSAEKTQRVFDWVTVVPGEWASNVAQGEGFTNAEDPQKSIDEKGNFGVFIESLGEGILIYEGVNHLNKSKDVSKHNNIHKGGGRTGSDPGVGNGGGGRTGQLPGAK